MTTGVTSCCCAAPPPPSPRRHGKSDPEQAPVPPIPRQQGTGWSSGQLGDVDEARGIDVSHHQGDIDWRRVASDGVQVAYLKASEDTDFIDETYARNRDEANRSGIVVGAYHFADPSGDGDQAVVADARAEAEHFLQIADARPDDLVPVLDLERSGGLTKQELALWTRTWMETVESALAVTPMIYTGPAGWSSRVGDAGADIGQRYPLWLAHWTDGTPTVPGAWQSWTGWQYTSDGSVDGIHGRVDMDTIRNPSALVIANQQR